MRIPVLLVNARGDPERKRAHIRHDHIPQPLGALLDPRAKSGSLRYDMVRISHQGGRAGKQLRQIFLKDRHTRRSADEYHAVQLSGAHAAVADGAGDHRSCPCEQRIAERAERFPIQSRTPALLALPEHHGQRHVRLGQMQLCGLRQGEQARPAVRGEGIESDPVFTAEIVHNRLIHIVSAQVIVSRHRYNLDNVFKAVYHAHIERPAAEIHQQKPAILPAGSVAVAERGSRRLVDQPFDGQPGQLRRQLGGASLVVVEVSRNADDRFLNLFSQKASGVIRQLFEHQSGQLMWEEGAAAERVRLFRSHPSLKRSSRAIGMRNQAFFCRRSNQNRPVLQHTDTAGSHQAPKLIFDQLRLSVPVNAGQRVCGSQINAYHRHGVSLFSAVFKLSRHSAAIDFIVARNKTHCNERLERKKRAGTV